MERRKEEKRYKKKMNQVETVWKKLQNIGPTYPTLLYLEWK